jgi:hypothetical protein
VMAGFQTRLVMPCGTKSSGRVRLTRVSIIMLPLQLPSLLGQMYQGPFGCSGVSGPVIWSYIPTHVLPGSETQLSGALAMDQMRRTIHTDVPLRI